jgi:hypothetical protein
MVVVPPAVVVLPVWVLLVAPPVVVLLVVDPVVDVALLLVLADVLVLVDAGDNVVAPVVSDVSPFTMVELRLLESPLVLYPDVFV